MSFEYHLVDLTPIAPSKKSTLKKMEVYLKKQAKTRLKEQ
jgi:hypothetical protein